MWTESHQLNRVTGIAGDVAGRRHRRRAHQLHRRAGKSGRRMNQRNVLRFVLQLHEPHVVQDVSFGGARRLIPDLRHGEGAPRGLDQRPVRAAHILHVAPTASQRAGKTVRRGEDEVFVHERPSAGQHGSTARIEVYGEVHNRIVPGQRCLVAARDRLAQARWWCLVVALRHTRCGERNGEDGDCNYMCFLRIHWIALPGCGDVVELRAQDSDSVDPLHCGLVAQEVNQTRLGFVP